MTTVDYYYSKSIIDIKIDGHAEYSKKGYDIVCSAISILTYALSEALLSALEKRHLQLTASEIESGSARFVLKPIDLEYTKGITDTVIRGFELLEINYPDYIKVIRREAF